MARILCFNLVGFCEWGLIKMNVREKKRHYYFKFPASSHLDVRVAEIACIDGVAEIARQKHGEHRQKP